MTTQAQTIYNKALKTYGLTAQTIVCIEELSELQKELTKFLRDEGDKHHLAEEIADAIITIEQMIMFYGVGKDIDQWRTMKLARLDERMMKSTKTCASHQPCWDCKKGNGSSDCSWANKLIPVEGWQAEKITKSYVEKDLTHQVDTYDIKFCPNFERG